MIRLDRHGHIVSPHATSDLMNLDEHSHRTCLEVSYIERRERRSVPADVVSHMQDKHALFSRAVEGARITSPL